MGSTRAALLAQIAGESATLPLLPSFLNDLAAQGGVLASQLTIRRYEMGHGSCACPY